MFKFAKLEEAILFEPLLVFIVYLIRIMSLVFELIYPLFLKKMK